MSDDPAVSAEPLDVELLQRWPLPVDDDGDKYGRGTVLVIGGSAGTPGAVILAGMAALRTGGGRLQLATDPSTIPGVAVAVPEARVLTFGADELGERIAEADCVVIGPGLLDATLAIALVRSVLRSASDSAVVVVDALGLTGIGAVEPTALERFHGRLVLTPNRQELARLCDELIGDDRDSIDAVARRCGAVVTSFGEVAAPDGRRWRTQGGHPSLGTSGSGDVLAGLVGGVAARCGDAAQAACWATLAHQRAGERLGRRNGQLGFLARELLDEVAPALQRGASAGVG